MSTFLVTGAAGFIGSNTSERLLESGNSVVGVDNLNDYYDVRLKQLRLERLIGRDGFEFVELDIESLEDLRPHFERNRFDGVLNLAARAGVRYSVENPFVYYSTNVVGILNLLELMKENGVLKLVLASTSSLYAGQPLPFTEDLPVNTPISPYAATKKAAEVLAYTYYKLYGIDVSILRYFTVYGPAGRPDMFIYRIIRSIAENVPLTLYGDGEQSRDFTYVDDIAEGTVNALQNVGYEIINLGGGKSPVTINAVIESVENSMGKKAEIRRQAFNEADMRDTGADISKAADLLGWAPKIGIDEGLKRSIDWYLANRERLA